jgi:hypothetical protein
VTSSHTVPLLRHPQSTADLVDGQTGNWSHAPSPIGEMDS